MLFFDTILAWAGFTCLSIAVIIGPWLFGAWEMWWFWLFATFIFIASLFFSIRLLLPSVKADPKLQYDGIDAKAISNSRLKISAVIASLIFLAYAFARFMCADVFMDSERSFLLHFSGFLVGIQIIFGFNRKMLEAFFALIIINLFALGLYGIINHIATGSQYVLWAEGFEQYVKENRASGSYFCPDHFSGVMELAFALSLGLILDRNTKLKWKISAVPLSGIALAGVVLSKSRGGGLTVIVILFAALVWGFSQWRTATRWCWRIAFISIAALGLIAFCYLDNSYVTRFKSHFGWDEMKGKPFAEKTSVVKYKLLASSRGRMIAGALRAWKDSPILGIGPGMHQNMWPHYAASPDGNRELCAWPSMPNYDFHSYEVHSDWVQLLEEYGVTGLSLFLIPAGVIFFTLMTGRKKEAKIKKENGYEKSGGNMAHAVVLGGLFSFVCMTFHSLGDFNLQMPATVWMLSAILSLAMAYTTNANDNI